MSRKERLVGDGTEESPESIGEDFRFVHLVRTLGFILGGKAVGISSTDVP